MAQEPLSVRSSLAPLVHPKPARKLSTNIKLLEASAETVDFKDNNATCLPAERTTSPLRPVRFSEISEHAELADESVEEGGHGTNDTGKQTTGFLAKLEAGLKRLALGDKTQKQQQIY